jgi:hypothetical protein
MIYRNEVGLKGHPKYEKQKTISTDTCMGNFNSFFPNGGLADFRANFTVVVGSIYSAS